MADVPTPYDEMIAVCDPKKDAVRLLALTSSRNGYLQCLSDHFIQIQAFEAARGAKDSASLPLPGD